MWRTCTLFLKLHNIFSGLQASQLRVKAEERHKAAAAREAALAAEAESLEAAKRQVATGGFGLVFPACSSVPSTYLLVSFLPTGSA